MASLEDGSLPCSDSSNLVLQHPTPVECVTIWVYTSKSWIDSLTLPIYLKESQHLTTVPLAKDGGMTIWILVDKSLPPGDRQILCSCESFWKHSLTSDSDGQVKDNLIHGIASVFCPPQYRRRGYAVRMMQELSRELRTWQTEKLSCVGTILYSDIGKEYYAKLGWRPNDTNGHVELRPKAIPWPPLADEVTANFESRVTIVPNIDHMGWHFGKEDFTCEYLFRKTPTAKGAIAGPPGSQVWALWTHRYYGRHDAGSTNNVLYILRLVMEADETSTRLPSDAHKRPGKDQYDKQLQCLKAVLQAAQAEATEWKLDVIKLWDPTPLVQDMLSQSGLEYSITEREDESIASMFWYDSIGGRSTITPFWVNNEHYAWL